ncbi:EscC/YscC/HrcC family type III secretion system outer membrane ring protein [Exilibacterium tricleocarpae]|uniref:EscC/YscC/HrcC family type III secretion system outer membrane ring protein n=1 Tax=Exilibacterium tricleocarpae TaxID=2591008 RepID=A0A545U3M0_9GAMM|nr:type III secretion system outer membrane ring subunit SctC [Exilibacterium tricleocarpae]TQV84070.1 EscC/YscC/HrcC family type III secretion system outer membrane ring protein [Exilibacterium tricleocarpae]
MNNSKLLLCTGEGRKKPLRKVGISTVFIILVLAGFSTSAGTPEFWTKSGFSFKGQDTPLIELLQEFALSYGVELLVSPGVSGYVDGWHRSDAGDEFLSQLGLKYQFQWFVFKGKLYISPLSDSVVKRVKVDRKSLISVEEALKGVDLLDKRFGWGQLKDEGVVLVSGPSKYVEFVTNLIGEKEDAKNEKEVMVFPLKHASVVDREIDLRDKKLVIPGAATILKKLLEGRNADALSMSSSKPLDDADSVVDLQKESYTKGGGKIEVEGDVRTNSIVIRDVRKKRDFYRKMIRKIDVEKKLIEIEAIIVDIDRQDLQEFGVDWQAFDVDGYNINLMNSLIQLNQSVSGAATIEISDTGSFQAMLQALESKGSVSIMANTSILTMENQPAVFDLSETQFIQTVGERVVDVEQVTAGTLLHVIPRNIGENVESQIQLSIDIEDGQVVRNREEDLPRIKKISINTSAVVDEGRSLVVGGYNIQQDTRYKNKVPILGDIPALGKLFSSKQKIASKKERLFIITPRISSLADIAALDSPATYGESLKKVSNGKNRTVAEKIRKVFRGLALEKITTGYEMKNMEVGRNPITCNIEGVEADVESLQYIVGEGLEIFVSTLENTTEDFINLDEELCSDNRVLAVSFWPRIRLSPAEKTEIYVAKFLNGKNKSFRPSLLAN